MKPAKLHVETLEDRSVPSVTNPFDVNGLQQVQLNRALHQTLDDGATNQIAIVGEAIIQDSTSAPTAATLTPVVNTGSNPLAQLMGGPGVVGETGTIQFGRDTQGYLGSPGKGSGGHMQTQSTNGSVGGGGSYVNGFGPTPTLNSSFYSGAGASGDVGGNAGEDVVVVDPETQGVMRFSSTSANGNVTVDIDADANRVIPTGAPTEVTLDAEDVAAEADLDEPMQTEDGEIVRMPQSVNLEVVDENGDPLLSITEEGMLVNPRLMPLLLNGELGNPELELLLQPRRNLSEIPDWLRTLLREANGDTPPEDVTPLEKSSALPASTDGQVILGAAASSPAAPAARHEEGNSPLALLGAPALPLASLAVAERDRLGNPIVVVEGQPLPNQAAPAGQPQLPGEQPVQLVREDEEEPLLDSQWAFFMLLGTGAALATGVRMRPDYEAEERRHRRVRPI